MKLDYLKRKYYTNQIIMVDNKIGKSLLKLYEYVDNRWINILTTKAYVGIRGRTFNKKEGDLKTPRGVYTLGCAFGIKDKPITKKKYIKLGEEHYFIDDSNSINYNKLVSIKYTEKDWNSAEHLIDYKTEYQYAIIINYNEKCIKKKGSAIFLHCSNGKKTKGCIAIEKASMLKLLNCIKEDAIICLG